MFSLISGRPIAKSDKDSNKKIILSIIDPDEEIKEVKKIKSCRGCGNSRRKRCCRHCDDEECQYTPCCNNCRIYYADEFGSSSGSGYNSSESDDCRKSDIGSRCAKSLLGKGMQMTKYNVPHGIKLIPLPDLTERFVDYIAGPSGSGKSTVASGIATEFKRVYPNKPIYIFSRTDARKDPAYKHLRPIQIDVDETLLEDPIDITDEIREGGALMIFDDCGTIQNDKLRKEVEKLMSDAMEVGRKLNCNMIITNHLVIPNEKKFARTVLNEFNTLTVFPKSGSAQQIRYALKTYIGLSNKQIDDILGLKSRWVRVSKTYPQYVLYDKGAYIL